MDVFLARQPIFDRKQKVYAYELLFRSGSRNFFDSLDREKATADVINNGFFSMDISQVTSGKRAFVNFTDDLLKSGAAHLLPKDLLTVEILETVEPDAEVIQSCKDLKLAGYQLALDDFIYEEKFRPLVELADIIKVDFMATTEKQMVALFRREITDTTRMLAEKIETKEMFDTAMALGCEYFQGYFFSKPVILTGKELSHSRLARLQILRELNRVELDVTVLDEIFRREVGLSYKLLKYVNSPVFGLRGRVSSIPHALNLLGQREMVKWLSLIILRSMGADKPEELMTTALVRARFGELLAQRTVLQCQAPTLFLAGMFSLLDVFLDRSMEEILRDVPFDEGVRRILTGQPGAATDLHHLTMSYEKGEWTTVDNLATKVGLEGERIPEAFSVALAWAKDLSAVIE